MTKHNYVTKTTQQYENEYDIHHNNIYNNNYNNIDTEPGVCALSHTDAEKICRAYNDCIGALNGAVAAMIEHFIQKGLTVNDIICAIEETAFAPRPSAAYLRAILRNWSQDGRINARIRYAAEHDKPQPWWRMKPTCQVDPSGNPEDLPW